MTDAPEFAIEARRLTKRFLHHAAVDRIDLAVPRGSAFALIGRNGAGKSTLLQMLLNLTRPTRGDVRVFGKAPSRLSESERARIGYVADGQDLPLWMTVGEFLRFLKPLYRTWDDAFCQRLLAIFDLPLGRKLRHLSRGQRVNAAFIGALAQHPRLLVLDEPFGGLDPAVREELLDALIELMNRDEWTVFVSSHEIDEVERLCDQVAVMDGGRLILTEDKDRLLARCRAVSLHTERKPDSAALSEHWWNPEAGEGRITFVDSAHEPERLSADVERLFPDVRHLHVAPATLKAICLALLRRPSISLLYA